MCSTVLYISGIWYSIPAHICFRRVWCVCLCYVNGKEYNTYVVYYVVITVYYMTDRLILWLWPWDVLFMFPPCATPINQSLVYPIVSRNKKINLRHWDGAEIFSRGRLPLHITMAVDVPSTQGVRPTAASIMTKFAWNIPDNAMENFICDRPPWGQMILYIYPNANDSFWGFNDIGDAQPWLM